MADCWLGMPPRLSQSWQSVLSFRINLRGSPEQISPKSQKNPLHAEPPRSNFVTVRKWYLSHQFALQIGSHAQNEFGGANLRTRIFLCQIACLGTRSRLSPNWQSVLSFRTILRSSPNYTDMLSAQSEFRKLATSSTESPVIFEINSSFNPCKIAFFAASTAFCRAPSSNAICRWCLIS